MLFWGVTYITCCYSLTLPLSEGLHLLFCVLYNVVLENRSVQNSPWGGGGSIASSRPMCLAQGPQRSDAGEARTNNKCDCSKTKGYK